MAIDRRWSARGSRWFAGGLAVLIVASAAGFAAFHHAAGEHAATAVPSLPRRVGAPSLFTRDAHHAPAGAASVVFSSDQWGLDGTISDTAVIGARRDVYRRMPDSLGSTAGITAILSPDGRRLAVIDGIVNLSTGAVTSLPSHGDYRSPEAWSPDGRYVATVTYTQPDFVPPVAFDGAWTPPVTRAVLSTVDTSDGQETTIGSLDMTAAFDGWLAAFSPDGSKLAYQSGSRIVVVTPTGAPVTSFDVPVGTRIAGKGAWSPDGSALAVTSEQPCGCGRAYDARWTLTTREVSTGAPVGPAYTVDGVVAIRILGWSPAGRPVVAASDAETSADLNPSYQIVDFRPHSDRGVDLTGLYLSGIETLDNVAGVRVLVLAATGAPRVLLSSSASGAESIDVADDVIAGGRVRPGHPPVATFDHVADAVAIVLIAGIATAIGAVWRRRRTRRRHAPAS